MIIHLVMILLTINLKFKTQYGMSIRHLLRCVGWVLIGSVLLVSCVYDQQYELVKDSEGKVYILIPSSTGNAYYLQEVSSTALDSMTTQRASKK